ncbi:MAG: HAMP domain-containing protein, partial [Actinomycetota bacterium]
MTLRTRLAALLALMLVGAVLTTGFVAVERMERALVEEVDALVFFRLSGPLQPGVPGERPTPADGGPRLTTDNNRFGDPDGRNMAEFVVDLDTDEVVFELLAGFDDEPLPEPDLSQVPDGALDGPVTITSVDGSMRYRAMTRLDTTTPGRVRVVAGSLASADETIADLRRSVGIAGLLAAALGAAIGWFVIRREARPLDDVLGAAEGFAAGDLARRAEITRPRSEIGRLGVGLNVALDRVASSVRAEQAANERLSAFVGDVAHELRTPATTNAGGAGRNQEGARDTQAEGDRMVERHR